MINPNLKTATLIRLLISHQQTLGIISTINNGQLFVAKTLELPNKGNAPSISCIPSFKTYLCKYTHSPAFNKKTYEIMDVPDRAGIRIHSANFVGQLRGCVALGSALKDINNDGLQDLVHSGNTMAEFEKTMNYEDFYLHIIDLPAPESIIETIV